MAEQTIEERLNELKQKQDYVGDTFSAADIKTLVEAIEYAMSHGGDVSVAVTPVENGYKITITDSEGNTQEATVQNGGDAYEVYKSTVQTPMNKTEWLASLKGDAGEDGHNPCLGRFSAVPSPKPTGQVGDYFYVDTTTTDQTTQEETTTTTVYHYVDDTNGWDDGTVINADHPTLASGQDVTAVHIKDLNGEDAPNAQGVLSAEAGKDIYESVFGDGKTVNVTLGKLSLNSSTGKTYQEDSNNSYVPINYIELPSTLTSGDKLIWNPGATGIGYLQFYYADKTEISSGYYSANATPREISVGSSALWTDSKYLKLTFDKDNIGDCYLDYVHNGESTRLFVPTAQVKEGMIDTAFPTNPSNSRVPSTQLVANKIEQTYASIVGQTKNIYSTNQYDGWSDNKYIDYQDGSEHNSTINSITGFINIEGYDEVELIMGVSGSLGDAGVAFYGSTNSNSFISGYSQRVEGNEQNYETRVLSIPANAKYIRCTLYSVYKEYWYIKGIKNSKIETSSTAQKVTLEFGNLNSSGQIKPYSSDFFDYARTSLYYKMSSINLPYTYKIYVFGKNYGLIEIIEAQANTTYELSVSNWHKIVIGYTENELSKKEIAIDLNVIATSYNIATPRTVCTCQYLVKYKKGRGIYKDDDTYNEVYNMADDLISNVIRFILPSNYSPVGEPVKLMYKAHGTNGFRWMNETTWSDSNKLYFVDEGFAIYDMFAGTSYYSEIINPNFANGYSNRIANYNIPIQLAAQKAAWEWITRNFNVDKNIYVYGKSHGGLAAIYATNRIVPTRAIALVAPLITQIPTKQGNSGPEGYFPWGLNTRAEVAMCLDDMCFNTLEGMTFDQMVDKVYLKQSGWKDILNANIIQQMGLNPLLNGITNVKQQTLLSSLLNQDYDDVGDMSDLIRHSDIPVKIWCATDDQEVRFADGYNWINTLQNGGTNAQFREYPSDNGGHSLDSLEDNVDNIRETIVTSLGVEYTAPVVCIEAVNFLNQF